MSSRQNGRTAPGIAVQGHCYGAASDIQEDGLVEVIRATVSKRRNAW
jgi:hypothetical protein